MQKGQTQVLILAGIVILVAVAGGIFFMGRTTAPKSQPQNVATPSPQPSPTPKPTPTSDETADWKTYTNTKYNLQFRYPPEWRVVYDKQPDPSGNPTKYSVVIEKDSKFSLITTILRSDQYQTFESLYNILNLPSETATITSRKEIMVNERKTLYISQNNSREGIITLDPKNNLIFLEVNSKDKTIFNQILSTLRFTN